MSTNALMEQEIKSSVAKRQQDKVQPSDVVSFNRILADQAKHMDNARKKQKT